MQINQFVSNFCFADAISNNVRYIQKRLIKLGFESNIYTQYPDQFSNNECKLYNEYLGNSGNILIMHASTKSPLHEYISKLPDKKAMIYHNITPSHFFEGFNDFFVSHLEEARSQLKKIANIYDLSIAVSSFNKKELLDLSFKNVYQIPLFFDFEKLKNISFDQSILKKFSDSSVKKILFLGRFTPNKKHEDLIKTFYIYRKYFNANSKLILVGDFKGQETYYSKILKLIDVLNLRDFVELPGRVSDELLASYYRVSDLFFSMSEHEGFFVPIIESYFYNLPVLAFDAGAISETMGDGGVLFKNKDYLAVSKLMDSLLNDTEYRSKILDKQKSSLMDFISLNDDFKILQILKDNFPDMF